MDRKHAPVFFPRDSTGRELEVMIRKRKLKRARAEVDAVLNVYAPREADIRRRAEHAARRRKVKTLKHMR